MARVCWCPLRGQQREPAGLVVMGGTTILETLTGVTSFSSVSVVHVAIVEASEWQYQKTMALRGGHWSSGSSSSEHAFILWGGSG